MKQFASYFVWWQNMSYLYGKDKLQVFENALQNILI
jgi:hypothetical protein